MATKIRNKVILGLILILAIPLGLYHFIFRIPAISNNGRGEERLTVTVEFSPNRREPGPEQVFIEFLINNVPLPPGNTATKSPWIRHVQLGKGQNFRVIATQAYGINLMCTVAGEAGSETDDIFGPGQVSCEYLSRMTK